MLNGRNVKALISNTAETVIKNGNGNGNGNGLKIRGERIKPDESGVYRITKDQRGQLKDQLFEHTQATGGTRGFGQIEVDGVPVKPKARPGNISKVTQGSDFKFNKKSGTQAADAKRAVRDKPSSAEAKFERQQFNEMHRDAVSMSKEDLMYQAAGATPYLEHKRRLNSPFWNTKRANGKSAGDADNLITLFDPDFKAFKDSAERYIERNWSNYDLIMDDFGDLAIEDIRTGKIVGYLNQSDDYKAQLDQILATRPL
jgi:hypothetical protein